jgi:hypothetical protein
MRPILCTHALLAAAALAGAAPALAQQQDTLTVATAVAADSAAPTVSTPASASRKAEESAKSLLLPPIEIQHIRPNDQRGINVFEAPKDDGVPFTGFRLGFGAAFTQQFQALGHRNTATSVTKTDAAGKP